MESRMSKIRHKILVLSGKGGVGKSTVCSQLALSFMKAGLRVGLLDVDLCGPSIPTILGLQGKSMMGSSGGWVPVYLNSTSTEPTAESAPSTSTQQSSTQSPSTITTYTNIDSSIHANSNQSNQSDNKDSTNSSLHPMSVMSIGFLLENSTDPVIWRGPKKTSIIRQFLEEVMWGDLDVLVIDTPPGTSDENISVCEHLSKYNPDGAIIVTTPQNVSLDDVRKEIAFCNQVGIPVLGIVENMSGFSCPCCGEHYNIFSKGGGQALAQSLNIPFIGSIPIDPLLAASCDAGKSFIDTYKDSTSLEALHEFAKRIKRQTDE